VIVPEFPALFAEFAGKRFTLLWRASRRGFTARSFHSDCNDRGPTLTLIQDKQWNVFGGFAAVPWSSRGYFQADPSLTSFLFTLKNPHNLSPRKFALKEEKKNEALCCHPSWGPDFRDIRVADESNRNCKSCSNLGQVYVNDTSLRSSTVFKGSSNFSAREIEVFEITD
jgi:hypothetical protein